MGYTIEANRPVLSSEEASHLAKLAHTHINHLLRTGLIEGVKVGKTWLVYEDSLMLYLSQSRKPGPKPRGTQAANTQSMANGEDISTD